MILSLSSNSSPLQRNPNLNLESLTDPSLRPANSAAFKRENRRKRKERKRQEKLQLLLDDWIPLADHRRPAVPTSAATSAAEWPSETFADRNHDTGWNLNPRLQSPVQQRPPASAEVLAQKNALRSCREYLTVDEGSDEEEGEDDDCNGAKSFDFFKELFDKEVDLRDFYRKDWAMGDFYCLVCGGIGEKLGKRFFGLAGLVQHANFISKTKRKMAHRAYGRVVCELLGWEIKSADGVDLEYNEDSTHSRRTWKTENTIRM